MYLNVSKRVLPWESASLPMRLVSTGQTHYLQAEGTCSISLPIHCTCLEMFEMVDQIPGIHCIPTLSEISQGVWRESRLRGSTTFLMFKTWQWLMFHCDLYTRSKASYWHTVFQNEYLTSVQYTRKIVNWGLVRHTSPPWFHQTVRKSSNSALVISRPGRMLPGWQL